MEQDVDLSHLENFIVEAIETDTVKEYTVPLNDDAQFINSHYFEEHIKTIDRTLSILPKETKVIIYLTGLTILTQAIYVWINRKKPFLDIELILAHYERREQNHIYYLAETGKRISHQYFL